MPTMMKARSVMNLKHGTCASPGALRLINSDAFLAVRNPSHESRSAKWKLEDIMGISRMAPYVWRSTRERCIPSSRTIRQATANQIEYFEKVFDLSSELSNRNQIWYWKELLTLVSLAAGFLWLLFRWRNGLSPVLSAVGASASTRVASAYRKRKSRFLGHLRLLRDSCLF